MKSNEKKELLNLGYFSVILLFWNIFGRINLNNALMYGNWKNELMTVSMVILVVLFSCWIYLDGRNEYFNSN